MKWLSRWKALYEISSNLNEVNRLKTLTHALRYHVLSNQNASQKMTEEQFLIDKITKFRKLQQKQMERNKRQKIIERYGRYHKKFVNGFGALSLAMFVGGLMKQSVPLIGAATTLGSLVALRYTYLLKGHDEFDEKYHNKLTVKRGLNHLKSYAALRQAEQFIEQLEKKRAEPLDPQSVADRQGQAMRGFGKTLKRLNRELARSAKLIEKMKKNPQPQDVVIETMDGQNVQMEFEDVPAYKDLCDQSGAIQKLQETGLSKESALYVLGVKKDSSQISLKPLKTPSNSILETMVQHAKKDYPEGLSPEQLLKRAYQVTQRWVDLRQSMITSQVNQFTLDRFST